MKNPACGFHLERLSRRDRERAIATAHSPMRSRTASTSEELPSLSRRTSPSKEFPRASVTRSSYLVLQRPDFFSNTVQSRARVLKALKAGQAVQSLISQAAWYVSIAHLRRVARKSSRRYPNSNARPGERLAHVARGASFAHREPTSTRQPTEINDVAGSLSRG